MLLEVGTWMQAMAPCRCCAASTMHVAQGEVIAVLGSNGAGKSTLNRVLERPDAAMVAARCISTDADMTGRDAALMVEAGLVHVPEGRRVFPNLSVRENLELGSYRRGRREPRAQSRTLRSAFFRASRSGCAQAAGTLSGGEQQMLAIGRGLMAEPKLLILDEPSLGLSPLLVEEMFGLIERIRADGPGILLVEQNVVQSLAIASRAYMLENGSVVLEGPAAALRDDPQLKKAYLGL